MTRLGDLMRIPAPADALDTSRLQVLGQGETASQGKPGALQSVLQLVQGSAKALEPTPEVREQQAYLQERLRPFLDILASTPMPGNIGFFGAAKPINMNMLKGAGEITREGPAYFPEGLASLAKRKAMLGNTEDMEKFATQEPPFISQHPPLRLRAKIKSIVEKSGGDPVKAREELEQLAPYGVRAESWLARELLQKKAKGTITPKESAWFRGWQEGVRDRKLPSTLESMSARSSQYALRTGGRASTRDVPVGPFRNEILNINFPKAKPGEMVETLGPMNHVYIWEKSKAGDWLYKGFRSIRE